MAADIPADVSSKSHADPDKSVYMRLMHGTMQKTVAKADDRNSGAPPANSINLS